MALDAHSGSSGGGSTSGSELMRAAAFNFFGGSEVLQPCLWSKPELEKGHALVRVVAAGVNPVDARIRAGTYFPLSYLTPLPKVPGGDLAGVVEQAGPGARFKPGDRVFALSKYRPFNTNGSYAEFASVAEAHLAHMPQGLSFEEAAGMPLVTLTVWQGLEPLSQPPGSRILIHGGSGAVGGMAIQFAKHVKRWHVTATCSPANAAYCRQLGADRTHDWHDAALLAKQYGREPFDVVFDVVGGRTTRDSLQYLKPRGRLVHVLISEANAADLGSIWLRGVLGLGPRLSMISVQPNGQQLAEVARLVSSRTLRAPPISRSFPLEHASDAHSYLEGPHAPGKVVLKVAGG